MTRTVAIKKSSLEGLSEGWDESCFAYVRPATYSDMLTIDDAQVSKKTKREQVEFQEEFIASHWVSGTIKTFDGTKWESSDMVLEDCFASQAICDKIYADITGVDLDPKDLAALKAAATMSSVQNASEMSTETPSSEGSPTSVTPQQER